jgi:hypothetical protein
VREQIEGVGPVVGKELDAAFHVFREVIFQVCSCYLSASRSSIDANLNHRSRGFSVESVAAQCSNASLGELKLQKNFAIVIRL